MTDTVLFTALLTFVLATVVMFLVPEKLFPKKFYNEAGLSKAEMLKNSAGNGYCRKVFLVSSAVILLLLLLIKYL